MNLPRRLNPILALIGLTLVVAVLYQPAFKIPFDDDDQMGYFFETRQAPSFLNGLRFVDYGINRTISKGDEILYRPLLFVLLALENRLFSYHHAYWNYANFCIFLTVIFLTYRVMARISPGIFAFLFTLLFAVSRAALFLARNIHLGGYLAGHAFFLLAVLIVFELNKRTEEVIFYQTALILCLTIACLFYELNVIFALPIILGLYKPREHSGKALSRIWLWIIPVCVYALAYVSRDFSKTHKFFFVANETSDAFFDIRKISSFPKDYFIKVRDFFSECFPKFREQKLALLGLFGLLAGNKAAMKSPSRPASYLFMILMFLYPLMLTLMRMDTYRNYYLFFFYLMMSVAFYTFFDFAPLSSWRRWGLAAFLIYLIGVNYGVTRNEILQLRRDFRLPQNYFEQLGAFVDQHKYEKGFSFSIEGADSRADKICEIPWGYPDQNIPKSYMPMSEVIFYKYFQKKDPLYTLLWDNRAEKLSFNKSESAV